MRKINIIAALLFGMGVLQAQTSIKLTLDPLTFNPPFRVNYGDTLSYAIELSNTDSIAVSGAFFIGFKGSNNVSYDSISLGNLQIAPGTSTLKTIKIDVKPEYFKTGPEVVVVWPIFDGKTGSEVADFIFVKNTVNNLNEQEDAQEKFFIASFKLECLNCFKLIKRVRIFDVSGKTIFSESELLLPLDLPNYGSGVFFFEIENESGRRDVLKWLK